MRLPKAALLRFVTALSFAVSAETARAQECGQFPDVITAPSNKVGNHACDSDKDGTVKDSDYCKCSNCALQPERCHRKGDAEFCHCDPSLQFCRPRPCIAAGSCQASDPQSYYWQLDCNDYNRNRFPGNCEICGNTTDEDCNSSNETCTAGADVDGDGVPTPTDCNDNNATVHPGATDTPCNSVDEDCSGADECGSNPLDPDGDGYSAPADCNDNDAAVHPNAADPCDGRDLDCDGSDCAADQDHDGFSTPGDCNDTNPNIHPGVPDLCGDSIDQDCAGGDRVCLKDQDRDGYDDATEGGTDCQDLDSSVHPGSLDVCGNGIDEDCSGADISCDQFDRDHDGHAAVTIGGDDCDDADDSVYPGAPEGPCDQIDSNCDGRPDSPCGTPTDKDADGFMGAVSADGDCNDLDSRINPSATEVCGNQVDDNCSGVVDEGCTPVLEPEQTATLVNAAPTCGCRSVSTYSHRRWYLFAALGLLGIRRRRNRR